MGWFNRREGKNSPQLGDALLVVDFETSGFSPHQGHRVVWLGAVWLEQAGITQTYSLSVADTDGLGVFGDAPPDVQRVTRAQLVDWLSGVMEMVPAVVAHNAPFDRKFAQAEFDAVGRTMPTTPWIDTVDLARALRPQWPDHKLGTCAAQLGLELDEHDALSDAIACAHLLSALRINASGRTSHAGELLDIIETHRAERRGRRNDESLSLRIDVDLVRDPDGRLRVVRPEYPICGEVYRNDITSPEHLAAHDAVDALGYDATLEHNVDALNALVAAGCPTAGEQWARLPYRVAGRTGKEQFGAALMVLQQFKDRGFATRSDIEDAAQALRFADVKPSDVYQCYTEAWRAIGGWLAAQGPCTNCVEWPTNCRDLDLAWQAAAQMSDHVDKWAPLLTQVGADAFLGDATLATKLRARKPREAFLALHEFRGREPEAWALMVTELGRQQEQQGNLDTARELFGRAVETGVAPVDAYDRLSLLLERAKKFTEAAAVASQGAEEARKLRVRSEILEKRAARCADKATRLA